MEIEYVTLLIKTNRMSPFAMFPGKYSGIWIQSSKFLASTQRMTNMVEKMTEVGEFTRQF